MTAPAAARRSTRDVAIELAACILAVQKRVGGLLAMQQPRIGRIDAQARAAFASVRADWARLATPVITDALSLCPVGSMPSGLDLAPRYVTELGNQLDADAAAALDVAMDLQLARGQHPDVAWQRAVAGYGLADGPMRSYIAAAGAARPEGGTALLATSKTMAFKALLVQADRIGTREAIAWSTLPRVPLTKAYDPTEPRDEAGRWAATPRGKRAKVADQHVPDAVDALLAQMPTGSDADRYAAADRYGGADRYARAARYAAATPDRYAAAAPDRYAAAGADRYAVKPKPRGSVRRIVVFGDAPNTRPPEPDVDDNGGYGLYVPMDSMNDYYNDHLVEVMGGPGSAQVDFGQINEYLQSVRSRDPVQIQEYRSGWDAADGAAVDPGDWQDVLGQAVDLWHGIDEDPLPVAERLDSTDLAEIAKRAGYPLTSKTAILDEMTNAVNMRDRGIGTMRNKDGVDIYYDSGLLEALADYVVWSKPESMGERGRRLLDRMDDFPGFQDEVKDGVLQVMSFGHGLAEDEDFAALHGAYRALPIVYSSSILQFGYAAPPGKIALREIRLKPDRV